MSNFLAGWGMHWRTRGSVHLSELRAFELGGQRARGCPVAAIMIRTSDDYIKFYDQPGTPPSEVVRTWWNKYRRFWALSDTSRAHDRQR